MLMTLPFRHGLLCPSDKTESSVVIPRTVDLGQKSLLHTLCKSRVSGLIYKCTQVFGMVGFATQPLLGADSVKILIYQLALLYKR